jgi:hypothetical protein
MKFEKAFEAFAAFLETLSLAIMTAANSINPVVIFFRCACSLISTTDFGQISSKLAEILPMVADFSEIWPVWKIFGQL